MNEEKVRVPLMPSIFSHTSIGKVSEYVTAKDQIKRSKHNSRKEQVVTKGLEMNVNHACTIENSSTWFRRDKS